MEEAQEQVAGLVKEEEDKEECKVHVPGQGLVASAFAPPVERKQHTKGEIPAIT